MTKGCVHIHFKDGDITNVFCHLSEFPGNGVIHLVVDKIYTNEEFIDSHPMDKNEVSMESAGGIYNLGKESIEAKGIIMDDFVKNKLNDPDGFSQHCAIAVLIIKEFGLNPHTKYHIRGAIREATKKVTYLKGQDKDAAHFVSKKAIDQISNGETRGLVLEHAVPVSYINQYVIACEDPEVKDVEDIVLKWTILAVITKEEDSVLSNLKLHKTMPEDWDGEDKLARYKAAGIEVEEVNYKDIK